MIIFGTKHAKNSAAPFIYRFSPTIYPDYCSTSSFVIEYTAESVYKSACYLPYQPFNEMSASDNTNTQPTSGSGVGEDGLPPQRHAGQVGYGPNYQAGAVRNRATLQDEWKLTDKPFTESRR